MALTDIVAPPGTSSTLSFNRGNVGTLEDIQAKDKNNLEIPQQTGAGENIFIMSE